MVIWELAQPKPKPVQMPPTWDLALVLVNCCPFSAVCLFFCVLLFLLLFTLAPLLQAFSVFFFVDMRFVVAAFRRLG